jgi:hypothetical protein
MSRTTSPVSRRPYGLTAVCRVWPIKRYEYLGPAAFRRKQLQQVAAAA